MCKKVTTAIYVAATVAVIPTIHACWGPFSEVNNGKELLT